MLPPRFLYSISPIFALRIRPQNAVSLAVLLSVSALALGCGIAFFAKLELSSQKKPDAPPAERQSQREQKHLNSGNSPRLTEGLENSEAKEEVFAYATVQPHSPECDFTLVCHQARTDNESETHSFVGSRKAKINLDVISQNFKEGELVTLDALKEKNLVSQKAEYVKILARGSLTKPLIIEAHDFSHSAEKMLTAVGGEAIRIK